MRPTIAVLAALVVAPTPVLAHGKGCNTNSCDQRIAHKQAKKKKHARIGPHIPWLRSTGDCENAHYGGPGLKEGLRAISVTGIYRGRYQFDDRSWRGAGGHGDPVDADWLEQAYRAVRWLEIAGVGAWPRCGA